MSDPTADTPDPVAEPGEVRSLPTGAPVVSVWSGSNRTGSYNTALAQMFVDRLVGHGLDARLQLLGDLGLPLFDADLNESEGPPPAARQLQADIAGATAVVIVSPEYNRAMTPLLKNTVDWVSRVDMATFLGKKLVLATATPGRHGGEVVLEFTSRWLSLLGAEMYPDVFGLPSVRHVMDGGVLLDGHAERLDGFVERVAGWFHTPPPAPQ